MSSFILNKEQQDCLQGIIDITLEQASDQLAQYLGTLVHLRVLKIQQINSQDFTITLDELSRVTVVVSQGFFGCEGICGEALMIYQAANSDGLNGLLDQDPKEVLINEQIIDLGAMAIIAVMNVFAKQINNQMIYGSPRIIFSSENDIGDYIVPQEINWKLALRVKISFQLINYPVCCVIYLLLPESAIRHLKNLINQVLTGYSDG
jgi:chemotaxis protein CheC